MTVTCLGWGSLIWKPDDLPQTGWQTDGPLLPVEFTRQSGDGRITLVIAADAVHVRVLRTRLKLNSVDESREALAKREGCPKRRIGYWSSASSSNLDEAESIGRWAGPRGITGVVWTALKPKFGDEYRKPSCCEVIKYLGGLSGLARAKAEEYVRRAPAQIRTAYRETIEGELGWRSTQEGSGEP